MSKFKIVYFLPSFHLPRSFANFFISPIVNVVSFLIFKKSISSSRFISSTLRIILISFDGIKVSISRFQFVFNEAGHITNTFEFLSFISMSAAIILVIVLPNPWSSDKIHFLRFNKNLIDSSWCFITAHFGFISLRILLYLVKSISIFEKSVVLMDVITPDLGKNVNLYFSCDCLYFT